MIYLNKALQPPVSVVANKLMPNILKISEINVENSTVTAIVSYYEYDAWQAYMNPKKEEDTDIVSLQDTGLPNVITASIENIKDSDYPAMEDAIYAKLVTILNEDGYNIQPEDIVTFD